jgi:hypothetical protein
MSSTAAANGAPSGVSPTELAAMLRQSAEVVERKEFHPLLYQTMRALTAYAGEYADGGIHSASAAVPQPQQQQQTHRRKDVEKERDPPGKRKSAFHDVPDSVLDGQPATANNHHRSALPPSSGAAAAANRVTAPGGQFSSAASAASGKDTGGQHKNAKGGFSLKSIKKGIEKIGADLFVGDHTTVTGATAAGGGNKEDAPFDEYAWCDEHFTRGCACKLRKGGASATSGGGGDVNKNTSSERRSTEEPEPKQQQQQQPSTTLSDPDRPAKPCFQRPINPSSNLIANGWIDQQRRSKMRVVWKDVLASLVEGRRPGEETTLWIQRQVMDPNTGKVTGLEALHQVPMKWLEDVNYVDIYGDHRFTLKVYNIAEEFYFRTRDEQSAQSWVLTLRSARDASLESAGRMGVEKGMVGNDGPSQKEMGGMGLHNLDDWDALGKQQGAGGNEGSDSRPSSSQSQQSQSQPRMKIAELRAIAHGAGYDTRGMERSDLERITATVQRGGAPSSAPSSKADPPQTQQAEKREQDMARAQEEARRQHEIEERAAYEKMRCEREEGEMRRAAEQQAEEQRRREEDQRNQRMEEQQAAELRQRQLEEQIAESKRRQEQERMKRVAELQASELKRRQDEDNARRVAELQAAAERKKREDEEMWRRQQQQQQQQAQTNYNSDHSAPNSGNYPQGSYQQQQQWHQQQQAQWHYQQQQQAQFQQAQFRGQQPHPNQQFPSNQQFYNGQQAQQPPQKAQYQQQQQPPRQQPQPAPSSGGAQATFNAKYMEEKSGEEQSAATLQIKRNILINWALLPPNLNVLRPIDQLITTIHTAMPPAYGVQAHNYFAKFTPINRNELIVSAAMGNHPDENKLKKAVRKVRVFLHPDKLPRDLSADQQFMARMLWDITSDSWEEFLKHKDELDWIRS